MLHVCKKLRLNLQMGIFAMWVADMDTTGDDCQFRMKGRQTDTSQAASFGQVLSASRTTTQVTEESDK